MATRTPTPLAFKPDLEDTVLRWEAYFRGEMIDRPIVCVTAPREDAQSVPGASYHERAYGDMHAILDRTLAGAAATYYGGEAVPSFGVSFGPDEIAHFCGAGLCWSEDSGDTNWSVPCVDDWASWLPLKLDGSNPLWQRMIAFYRLAAERLAGKMALGPPDLHTNMDLLAAMRGPQQLCLDLLDRPEVIDRAMDSARAVFRELWTAVTQAGRMDELGYCAGVYSMEGAAVLQCDFSYMIGPAMFDRWVLPALEEEADIVKHVLYHWDGPGALLHTSALCASRGIHTLSYTTGAGHGEHIEYFDLFRRVQAGGKAVQFYGSPDELKAAHRELRPEKVAYSTHVNSPKEAEELLAWFVRNT